MTLVFPEIHFNGQLRPSQVDVVELAKVKLADGARRLHIVAPPGSGKTVLGLYLWARLIRQPALVLAPNSAIQAQWAARTDLFEFPGSTSVDTVSLDPRSPALLTSLTYQAVTLPGRADETLDDAARRLWVDRLIERRQADDPEEARVWIDDLQRHNLSYHDERLSHYRKQIRDQRGRSGQALENLHKSSRQSLQQLKNQGIGLILLDECHHLIGHWGRVLAELVAWLDHPVVVGLTATPPERSGRHADDVLRYDQLLGEIDYEVPIPAVVKDGFLAPYQDLVYFVRPTVEELDYLATTDQRLLNLLTELESPADEREGGSRSVAAVDQSPTVDESVCAHSSRSETARPEVPRGRLPGWLFQVLESRTIAGTRLGSWRSFEARDPDLAFVARQFLQLRSIPLPDDVPPVELDPEFDSELGLDQLVVLLDRFVRHFLRRSATPENHALAERIVEQLRLLGYQITETACRPCASPVSRVLAYGHSKITALPIILAAERKALGDRIRAVVIADYEKTSSTAAQVDGVLDAEAGGAIAAFRQLLRAPHTDDLDPILVTGSSVLVDDDAWPGFERAALDWLEREEFDVDLIAEEQDGFHVLNGRGADWCPRVYVALITELFQTGLTRCLVGTRGLLGEGWDANRMNVLIDLTTVTTSMSVNQLRGRSIRLDPHNPRKLANNWDVVCLAPEFLRGFDDYRRFIQKHATVFGVTDDGAIEKGVGHVHPALTELKPEGVEATAHLLNEDMLQRAGNRDSIRELWKIGLPFHPQPVRVVEVCLNNPRLDHEFPPFGKPKNPWSTESLALAIGQAIVATMHDLNLVALAGDLNLTERAGGYVRLFLEGASESESELFCRSLQEALGPVRSPRYVIPREVMLLTETLLSRLLPGFLGDYFVKRRTSLAMLHAVPTEFARNRRSVDVYQRHWNQFVSPGQACFARKEQGRRLIESARQQGQLPRSFTHEKEVFLC